METVLFFLPGVLIVGLCAFGIFIIRKQQFNAMLRVSSQHGGHVVGGWLKGKAVALMVAGVTGRLTCFSGSRIWLPYTRLEFDAPFPERLRVGPKPGLIRRTMARAGFRRPRDWLGRTEIPSARSASFGSQEFGEPQLQIGDPQFDSHFQIQTEGPERYAREILTPEIRREMSALLRERPTLDLGSTTFTFHVPHCLPPNRERLATFYRAAIRIFEALRGHASSPSS